MKKDRKTIRLRNYNYSDEGGYFTTVCTIKNEFLFGQIIDQKMVLNEVGAIVKRWWLKIEENFNNVETDYFSVMPNHFHGIIIISNKHDNAVGAIHELPLQDDVKLRRKMLLPKIMGYFKMNSAKYVNISRGTAGSSLWQRGYYEHIIRNETELYRIRNYIQNNPLKWDLDRENPLSRNFNLAHCQYWRGIYDTI